MHEAIVEKLYNEYIANGFISEDKVFDTLQKEGLPLFDVEYICDQLLARGVILLEENDAEDDDNEDESTDLSQIDYKAVYSEIIELDEGLCDIVEYMRNVQPPQRREWQILLPQAQNGNLYARNRVFEMYMRVAAKIALQYAKRYDLPIADTMQDGFFGLSIAIDKFEYGMQDHFATYFPFWIRQNIMRVAQIQHLPIYLPVHVKDRLFVINDLEAFHNCEECGKSTVCPRLISEIARTLETDEKEAEYLYSLLQTPISIEELLEAPVKTGVYEYSELSIDGEGEIIEYISATELRSNLDECISTLTPKEKLVIRLRYGFDDGQFKTLEEIGDLLSVSRERIRQIESKALRKLRHPNRSKKLVGFISLSSHKKIYKEDNI